MIPGIGAITPDFGIGPAGSAAQAGATATAGTAGGVSFADMVAQAAGGTIGALKQAEQVSIDALQGKAEMRQVVDAVMSAEQSFQAAVAIRDKIVSAYLEISRMAI